PVGAAAAQVHAHPHRALEVIEIVVAGIEHDGVADVRPWLDRPNEGSSGGARPVDLPGNGWGVGILAPHPGAVGAYQSGSLGDDEVLLSLAQILLMDLQRALIAQRLPRLPGCIQRPDPAYALPLEHQGALPWSGCQLEHVSLDPGAVFRCDRAGCGMGERRGAGGRPDVAEGGLFRRERGASLQG